MKTLRRIALLAAFALITPAFAGPPPGVNTPAPTTAKTFTADELATLVKGEYKGAEAISPTVSIPKQAYKLTSGQTAEWSVQFGLMTRGTRPPVVRIFFPCQKLPAKPNAERLAKLMNQNGGGNEGPAYFMVGGKDADYLYIVSEVATAGLTGDTLRAEVLGLFAFADRTLSLWGEDLDTAPKATKAEKSPLVGTWKHNKLLDKNVGVVGLTLGDDGQGSVDVYEVSNAPPTSMSGAYILKGDELTLSTKTATFTFTVKQKGDDLTISYKEDGETVTRTLTRKK